MPGASAAYTYVAAGGYQYNSASSYGADVYGVEYTEASGLNSSTTIEVGGEQDVESGGTADGVTVRGNQFVSAGGVAASTFVLTSEGLQILEAGGTAYHTDLSSGGNQDVYGGVASGTTIASGGYQLIEGEGSTACNTVVSAGGDQTIYGGVASGAEILSGGVEHVLFGGVDSASTISNGGQQTVYAGGSTYADTVASGGAQNVSGLALSATISNDGTENVLSGGSAGLSQVYGSEVVSSGGVAYADRVHSGGVFTVLSGGSVTGGLTISGGTASIFGAVENGQEVLFAGHGDLAFHDLAAFDATIGGYSTGDEFDLGGFAFGASETRSFTENSGLTGGTLSVTDGSRHVNLSLLGSYVTSDFALTADGHGGTFVKFV